MELLCWTGAEGVYCRRVIQRTLFCFCEFEKCDITGSIVVSSDNQNVKIYWQFRKCNFEVQTWNWDCSESREVTEHMKESVLICWNDHASVMSSLHNVFKNCYMDTNLLIFWPQMLVIFHNGQWKQFTKVFCSVNAIGWKFFHVLPKCVLKRYPAPCTLVMKDFENGF